MFQSGKSIYIYILRKIYKSLFLAEKRKKKYCFAATMFKYSIVNLIMVSGKLDVTKDMR